MTPDNKRAILEPAAKACGLPKHVDGMGFEQPYPDKWNHIDNSLDTSAMCAKLDIATTWTDRAVICIDASYEREQEVRHDSTQEGKEAAWRLAATTVAAKVGGYTDE